MNTLAVSTLTEATLEGGGVFDVLMRANKAHLEAEFNKNRIKGPEYSSVYLGSLTQVLQTAVQFLLAGEKLDLEKQLLEQQILLAKVEVEKANAQVLQIEAQTNLAKQQTANALAELAIIQANALKVPAEIAEIEAKTRVLDQQKINLSLEAQNIPKQGELITAQTAQAVQQTVNLVSQKLQIDAQTGLINQQKANAVIEGTVLVAQECKLRAEFDLIAAQIQRTAQETTLMQQKVSTEKAQTQGAGVDEDSVIGKQKKLYEAQSQGFARDAEQKAAKLLVDSWNVRRTTDEGTVADGTNMLNDSSIGRAVNRLLAGVNA